MTLEYLCKAIKQRDRYSNSAAAYHELERGATLHTREAVSWMPLKWSGKMTKGKSDGGH